MFRPLAVTVLVLGIWLGLKAEKFFNQDRCRDAGGVVDARGVCVGVRPQ